MFVTAPPMPTTASGRARSSSRERSAAIASFASASVSGETALGEPERLRERTAPTGTLKRSSTRPSVPERELAAAAAGVEHDERAAVLVGTGTDALVGEPALLVAGDDLDRDACSAADRVDDRGTVPRGSQARGADRNDRQYSGARASSTIAAIASASGLGVGRDVAALGEAFAEAGDLGTVGQRRQPSACPFGDAELDRVRPDVDHRDSAPAGPR